MEQVKTIFLADDDVDDRMILIDAIRTMDPQIRVIEADNGQQLLKILLSEAPIPTQSLIILDVYMPKMD